MEAVSDKEILERIEPHLYPPPDVEQLLAPMLAQAVERLNARRGFVLLIDQDRPDQAGEHLIRAVVSHNLDDIDISDRIFEFSRGVVGDVLRSRDGRAIMDMGLEQSYNTRLSVMRGEMKSVLCVPLQAQDRLFGALYLDNRAHEGAFGPDELKALSAYSRVVGLLLFCTLQNPSGPHAPAQLELPSKARAQAQRDKLLRELSLLADQILQTESPPP